ncbi:MAG: hypothetical protein KAI18_01745, partial [Candidatus Aenigmarchaeota archaeon]|nr:hypothetical protein [Candidatus Aenigmarchaeota archaeon]
MGYFKDLDQLVHDRERNSIFNPYEPIDVVILTRPIGDLSDFNSPKKRDNPLNILPELKQYYLDVSEEDRKGFLKCYSSGSKDNIISDSNFDCTYYLELFMFLNIDNALDNKIGQSDKNKDLFFEWAYENRNSFDIKRIPNDIFAYLDKK